MAPLSKILAKISPEYGFWKGPGRIVDNPIEDGDRDPFRIPVLEGFQPESSIGVSINEGLRAPSWCPEPDAPGSRMLLDGAGDPYFFTPLSKILTGTLPEYGFWKGPGQDLR